MDSVAETEETASRGHIWHRAAEPATCEDKKEGSRSISSIQKMECLVLQLPAMMFLPTLTEPEKELP